MASLTLGTKKNKFGEYLPTPYPRPLFGEKCAGLKNQVSLAKGLAIHNAHCLHGRLG